MEMRVCQDLRQWLHSLAHHKFTNYGRFMPSEANARKEFDRQLEATGWIVRNYMAINIMAGPGIAVKEFPSLLATSLSYTGYPQE